VEFSGSCTECGSKFVWEELSQELSCLEAKNNGYFGDCRRGVAVEKHSFDQECNSCTALAEVDEAVAGMDEENEGKQKGPSAQADRNEEDDGRSKKKRRTR